jgi:hypothetical protein
VLISEREPVENILSHVTWTPWPKTPDYEYFDIALLRISRNRQGRYFARELDEDGDFVGGAYGALTREEMLALIGRLRPELMDPCIPREA